MKLDLFNAEANKIWKRVPGEPVADLMQVELDLYKKLLEFFQIGDCCYLIFNFQKQEIDFVSKEITTLLGYHPEEMSTRLFMESVHPDDRAWFISCQEHAVAFQKSLPPEKQMKYKMRFDFRIRKKNGITIRVMMQVVVIHNDDNGGIYRTLIVFTDITHLKPHGQPTMSYIGLEGEPSFQDVHKMELLEEKKQPLSKREREVLALLAEGKASKEIGLILHISKQTVDKHRKNMLQKSELKNTGELISKALKNGWI